ncbi:MAG: efflux RND transporter periplasmic adaptor subunit [Gemmatimonas sp.]|nr:efflux RND transporter periplasmic adaptor subunit [Gemmatimonas sp.]
MKLKTIRDRKAALLIAGLAAVVAAGATLAARATEMDRQRGEGSAAVGMEGMDTGGMNMTMDGSVQLTAEELGQFGVAFGTVDERTLESGIRTVGIVTFDETRMAHVAPKFGGFIEHLYVDFTGQQVRAGQPLAEIYSPELVSAQEELLLSASLDQSLGQSPVPGVRAGKSNLAEVARRRLRLWDISDSQIDRVVETGEASRTLTLFAPVSGIVVEKPVLQGEAIQPGQSLYTIADLADVWIEAELRERDAGAVREGSEAVVELDAFPGRPIRGQVDYVYPTLESTARTLTARIPISNPDGRLKPGMYATVRLSMPTRTALTVPASAVVYTGERSLVFVDMGAGKLMPQEVEIGTASGEYTEVLAGVEPGQSVVTSAQYLLDSESNMAEVMRSMMGMTAPSDMENMGMDMSDGSPSGMQLEGMEMQGADVREMTPPDRE